MPGWEWRRSLAVMRLAQNRHSVCWWRSVFRTFQIWYIHVWQDCKPFTTVFNCLSGKQFLWMKCIKKCHDLNNMVDRSCSSRCEQTIYWEHISPISVKCFFDRKFIAVNVFRDGSVPTGTLWCFGGKFCKWLIQMYSKENEVFSLETAPGGDGDLWLQGLFGCGRSLRFGQPLHVALREPAHLPLATAVQPALLSLYTLIHLNKHTTR